MIDASRPSPTPREWLQDEPFPWASLDDLAEGVRVSACYCVESKVLSRTKDDKPYLRLQLCDRSGSIEGRVWEDAERIDRWVTPGEFVGVRGRVQTFRGQRQFKVEEVAAIAVSPDELDLFLPRTPFDLQALEAGLDALVASIDDRPLRTLVRGLLDPASDTGHSFRRAPAAKRNHHAYVGGLLEHSLSVARACDALARHYGALVDRDLLVAGALVHDIGKIREIGVSGGFPYTDPGKLLGHIVLGIQIIQEAARDNPDLPDERLLLLLHLVASHQGRYEWQSPKIPMTLEALLLHYVDDLDAKFHQAAALVIAVESGWSAYDGSFGREFLRHRSDESVSPYGGPAWFEFADPSTDGRPEGDGGADTPRSRSAPAARPAEELPRAGDPAPDDSTLDLFRG